MSKVGWVLETEVKDLDSLKAVMADLVAAAEKEVGTTVYEWFLSDDQKQVQHIERFTDSDAALAHLGGFGPHAGRFMASCQPTKFVVRGEASEALRAAIADFHPQYLTKAGGFSR